MDVAAPSGARRRQPVRRSDRTGLPLAVRMRPRSLDEVVGQPHLLAPGSPLRRLAAGEPMSVFLWGPPGTGKTTIASVVSRQSGSRFVEVSAVTAGVKEVRAVLDQARRELARGQRTVLFVDEVHRFSKTQQDVLLPAVENRLVTLVAATTENPSFSVISPLLSRSLLLTLRPLTDADVSAPARPRPGRRARARRGGHAGRRGPLHPAAARRRGRPPGADLPRGVRRRARSPPAARRSPPTSSSGRSTAPPSATTATATSTTTSSARSSSRCGAPTCRRRCTTWPG